MTINQALQVWSFEESPIRTMLGDDGDPRWVAADVCRAIGINSPEMAYQRLDDDEKGISSTDTPGGPQEMLVVNESGLYSLVLGSRQERAKRFRKWITSEVLPTIRKTGRFDQSLAQYNTNELQLIEADPAIHQTRRLLAVMEEQVIHKHRLAALEVKQQAIQADLVEVTVKAEKAINTAESVETSYLGRTGFKTALGYAKSKGYTIQRKYLAVIGRAISAYCKHRGIDRKGVADEHWDEVKSYPIEILDAHEYLFKKYDDLA